MKYIRYVLFSLFLLSFSLSNAQDNPIAFTGAKIIPIEGPEIENGTVVIHKGKIVDVGPSDKVKIPRKAETIDATGKVIMPGLVDTHSHIGGPAGGDGSGPLHPGVRVLDSVDPFSDTFKKALAGGITTVNVMPGSGHLMSGQTLYLKTKKANVIEDMLVYVDKDKTIYGGMKMANGTNSIRGGAFPGTRGKSAALARQMYVKAQQYKAKKDKGEDVGRDLEMEALVEILEGKRIVHFHTHRADDIMSAVRLSKEFGFRVVLHHTSEAWKVADELAEAKVPASIIHIDSPGGKLEAVGLLVKTGAVLEQAGVKMAYHTDDGITDSRWFLRSPAMGMRAGLSREGALLSVTLAGAEMLDLADRVGSLKKGKDADLVILSGDPFSVYTKIEQTWIEGKKEFDKATDDGKYSIGGWEVFRGEHIHSHDEEGAK